MTLADSSLPSQAEPVPQRLEHGNAEPFFAVTGDVTFKPLLASSERDGRQMPPVVTRLVSLIGLGAIVLTPLSGCGSTGDTSLPCPVPKSTAAGTPVPTGTPTVHCTTSSGTHYLWFPSRGGWVASDDGIHPNKNASGVGEDTQHSSTGGDTQHSGVGDGHSGSGGHSGGSEGG